MALCRIGRRIGVAVIVSGMALLPTLVFAQARPATTAPTTPPARSADLPGAGALTGRMVEDVRIVGNTEVSTAIILNLVRTRPGEKFDPVTAQEDYQRIYGLRKFSNVEAKVEPTATGGVIVIFTVSEVRQIKEIIIQGNSKIDEFNLRQVIDVSVGEAIDQFRISLSTQAIVTLYKDKNFPFAHVNVDKDRLARTGQLVFTVVEGPNVRVRKIEFIGRHSFTYGRLMDQIRTRYWIWIFRAGTYDPNQIDDDVASLRRYYQSKGFFDVRVGRKIIFSPDMTEVQVNFVIDEGIRYIVDKVTFKGNKIVSDEQLRKDLKLVPGEPFDNDVLQRDIRQVVRPLQPLRFHISTRLARSGLSADRQLAKSVRD